MIAVPASGGTLWIRRSAQQNWVLFRGKPERLADTKHINNITCMHGMSMYMYMKILIAVCTFMSIPHRKTSSFAVAVDVVAVAVVAVDVAVACVLDLRP